MLTADKIDLNCKTKQLGLETRPSHQEANYYKIALRVHGSVQASDKVACIAAGRVGDSETHAFDAISI